MSSINIKQQALYDREWALCWYVYSSTRNILANSQTLIPALLPNISAGLEGKTSDKEIGIAN